MATNRETYKSDELLARAFDWHCDITDCSSCKHYALRQGRGSRSYCFLAWLEDEAGIVLALKPCRFCGSEAHLSYGNAIISCDKCGYEVQMTYVRRSSSANLRDTLTKTQDLWNKLQKGP